MRSGRHASGVLGLLLLAGCTATHGDFGELKPSLVSDGIHDWVGREAAREAGHRPSRFHLTEDERELRDLAYPLIEPSYDRRRWDMLLLEYGVTRTRVNSWPPYDRTAYLKRLYGEHHRSASGRYARLIDDIRNDSTRIDPFVATARRVLDMDRKRHRMLAYVSELSRPEWKNAQRRIAENAFVVASVYHSLRLRADQYQYALERLALDTPSPAAVEAERAVRLLRQQIAAARLG